jgi:hypothetical protein
MRSPEPKIVTLYRAAIRQDPPKCCHTCDYYTKDGMCQEYDAAPPELFTRTVDSCELWSEEIPF